MVQYEYGSTVRSISSGICNKNAFNKHSVYVQVVLATLTTFRMRYLKEFRGKQTAKARDSKQKNSKREIKE